MKKIFVLLGILSVFSTHVLYADDVPDYVMYESQGQAYFITKDLLAQLASDSDNTCLSAVTEEGQTKTEKFYELLISQCRQKVSTVLGQLKEHTIDLKEGMVPILGAGIMNRITKGSDSPLVYKGCQLTLSALQAILSMYETNIKHMYTINTDIDACINAIGIHSDENICPMEPSVANVDMIANIKNMNAEYQYKTVSFTELPNINSGQLVVFNGQIMVACDNGRPVHIVKPAFSGYTECRDAQYQSYPNVGTIPDGIYLAQRNKIDNFKTIENLTERVEKLKSWGGYRIPLIPSDQSETYGRANLYLHGTSDAGKRRSGGCISLGVAIDDFIESDWFQRNVNDLLIIVKKY